MKCEGKCGLLREAEYEVELKSETTYLCGICMLDRCIATNGLRGDVVAITRLKEVEKGKKEEK